MRSVRDVHQLRFLAFIVTCSAAADLCCVVLHDWSFVKLENRPRKHLGFRIIGAMVHHPQLDAYPIGSDWFSTEIKEFSATI